ncbi:Putative periplasmic protein [hydrothermal vent metagenome]|uniref:Putative periplasmic protein n=1 Tax=hydrothermal vent metagenome TaxID=652676 RepID=A0A1W1D7A2_9ZZZZ
MNIKKMINYSIFLVLVFLTGVTLAKIEYVTVSAQGSGITKNDAIQEAIVNAISQVNGVKVASKIKSEFSYNSDSENGAEQSNSHESFQKSVNTKTKGVVQSWDVISEQAPIGNDPIFSFWGVEIEATIAKYKASIQSDRLRMAVVPFRILSTVTEIDFERLFEKSLNSYLTQSRKFAMIDRKYSYEQQQELRLVQGDNFKTEEAARAGNQLGVDYLVLGVIDNANRKTSITHMRVVDKKIARSSTQIDLSFRIIDVATGQIKHAGEYSQSFAGGVSINSIASKVADSVGNDIINAIYPILVVDIDGDRVTLGQGGKTLKIGDKLKLIKYGEKIHDPYTGESLGYTEIEIGIVKITSVQSKLSIAEVVKLTVSGIDHQDKMIVRPINLVKKDSAQEGVVETEKEIKKNSRDFEKDDDW